jgi:competence ComEA-like helix-hairpin-helix protein
MSEEQKTLPQFFLIPPTPYTSLLTLFTAASNEQPVASSPMPPASSLWQKPYILVLAVGFVILLGPQLAPFLHQPTPAPAGSTLEGELLGQVARQHPHLVFQQIPINTATARQLRVVPGIGPELARRIIAHRTEHGPFSSLQELDRVPGIGPQKLAALTDHCRL